MERSIFPKFDLDIPMQASTKPPPELSAEDWVRVNKLRRSKYHELAGALFVAGWFSKYPHEMQSDSHLRVGFGFGCRKSGSRLPLIELLASLLGFQVTALRATNLLELGPFDTAEEAVQELDPLVASLTDEEREFLSLTRAHQR
jgi:hypothetical protein